MLGGTLPGPTVRAKRGGWLRVDFIDNLSEQSGTNTVNNDFSYPDETNLHFHGAHVSSESPADDTTIVVKPGGSFKYKVFFPSFHMGGTLCHR
jgi:FtsP/CotA-like multicopper oxidase with cupredoxin domain